VSTVAPDLRARAIRGFVLVGGQRAVALVVAAIGGVVLARWLGPDAFGRYAILTFVVGLGVAASDLGLSAALVQRRDAEPDTVIPAAFTLHMVAALAVAAAIALGAWVIVPLVGVERHVLPPLVTLALLLPLGALRMPAAVLLERRLAFLSLSIGDAIDTVGFYVVAGVAAIAGGGVWSLVAGAVVARALAATALLVLARWRPRVRWRPRDVAPVLRFGLPFQGTSMITLARDAAMPATVTAWSGVTGVGLLNWATSLAYLPIQVVGIAGKVLFPAFSRLAAEPERFALAAEGALNRIAVVLYPATLLLFAGADPIVRFVYGDAWLPAVAAVRLFSLSAMLGGTSTVLVHALNGLGRADTVFRLNVVWTVLLWGITLLLVPRVGFIGYAIASTLVASTLPLTAALVRRHVRVRVLSAVKVPLAAAAVAALLLALGARLWIHDLVSLAGGAAGSVLVYAALTWALAGARWRTEIVADLRAVR
jgi:O-antigen/teichoic acid export membrane protein